MKKIFEKRWDNTSKVLSIVSYRKEIKENGSTPKFEFYKIGGLKRRDGKCAYMHLFIGYIFIYYINYNISEYEKQRKRNKKWNRKR